MHQCQIVIVLKITLTHKGLPPHHKFIVVRQLISFSQGKPQSHISVICIIYAGFVPFIPTLHFSNICENCQLQRRQVMASVCKKPYGSFHFHINVLCMALSFVSQCEIASSFTHHQHNEKLLWKKKFQLSYSSSSRAGDLQCQPCLLQPTWCYVILCISHFSSLTQQQLLSIQIELSIFFCLMPFLFAFPRFISR